MKPWLQNPNDNAPPTFLFLFLFGGLAYGIILATILWLSILHQWFTG